MRYVTLSLAAALAALTATACTDTGQDNQQMSKAATPFYTPLNPTSKPYNSAVGHPLAGVPSTPAPNDPTVRDPDDPNMNPQHGQGH